ncbi:amidase family protein [Serratia rubidaea]|uniref:amidase family protein n=1 Tax=Serratia rubidaea TaxID=61652 RepID=UPI003FA399FC
MSRETAAWSLHTALQAIRERKLNASEFLHDLLAHERQVGDFNAYITPTRRQAQNHAATADKLAGHAGALCGIPLVVKDNIDVAGVPTTAATPSLRHHVPTVDAAVWRRLSHAGAVLLGKTSMHELAYGITGVCSAAPSALNPVLPGYLAGGSSSGTAAAVAAGLAPAGLGTDTGGSVRIPAALCGIVGFRPTTGRYPHDGILRISPSRDTAGLMARTLEDIILLDAIITGNARKTQTAAISPRQIRLGVPLPAWRGLSPEVAQVAYSALDMLERAGYQLVETGSELFAAAPEALLDSATSIPLAETADAIADYLHAAGSRITFSEVVQAIASPDVFQLLAPLRDAPYPQLRYRRAIARQSSQRLEAAEARRAYRVDAVVMPTTTLTAAAANIGEHVEINGASMPTFQAYIRNTAPATILALPSITLSAGVTAGGAPVGLLLDGHPYRDTHLLHIASHCFQLLNP